MQRWGRLLAFQSKLLRANLNGKWKPLFKKQKVPLKKMMDPRLPLYDEEQLKSWKVVFKMILNGITTG